MKKKNKRHYPLLTIDGKFIGMNVQFCKGIKYWNFHTWPDIKLDESLTDCVFRHLCEKDGSGYSLNHAFYDFPDTGPTETLSTCTSLMR